MRLQDLIDLADHFGIAPKDLVVVVTRVGVYEQEWSIAPDIHLATSEGEPELMALYIPEGSNV